MRITFVLFAALFSFILASCGGGGGGGTTPAAASTYSISGTVSGAVLQGVTINLAGTASASTTTNASGNYSFTGLANGIYTVTPSLSGHVFTPISTVVTVAGASVTGNSPTATASTALTYCLSGTVNGAVVQNVTITLNGANTGSTVTDASGNYSFCGLVSGDYTVTPSLAGYSSTSTSTITISVANVSSNNFTLAVTPSGSSIVFVTVNQLPQATVGVAYTNSVISSISGGSPTYHFQSDSFVTGAPPIGMIVDLNGDLTGTPSVAGTYTFGVCAVDLVGASSCKTTSISVVSVKTYSGSFSGSGSFSRVFSGYTTCTWTDSFTGTITVTMTTQANGATSSSAQVSGDFVSTYASGNTFDFTCYDSNTTWSNTLQASGTLPSIAWTDTFVLPSGSTVTGSFAGILSGNSITGTQAVTIDTSTGSASIPITLTQQ